MKVKILFLVALGAAIFSLPSASFAVSKYTLNSTTDFPNLGNNGIEFYRDTKYRALAINAANPRYRNKWARAETTFSGVTAAYDITINTLTERDGESKFRLFVNGVEVGSFVNPKSERSFQPVSHTWPNIQVPAGTSIAVESISHTNGKVEARVGTAWSRGRWRSLTLTRSK